VKLKYKCLMCGIEWGDPQASESDISHGFCPTCIRKRYTDRIHRSQIQAGYSDCFNRGYDDCSEQSCCFRTACLEQSVRSWREAIIRTIAVPEMEATNA
jgi:hypothetical protein